MIAMRANELAELAGLSRRRIDQINAEMSDEDKLLVKCAGGYDAARFVARWVDYNVSRAKPDKALDLDEEKALHERSKREKTDIQIGILKGDLINMEDAIRAFEDVASSVRERLCGLPAKLAVSLVMVEDAEEIQDKIDKEIRDTLTMLAEMPDIGTDGQDGMMEDDREEDG